MWPALVALAAIALFLGTRAKHPVPAPVADTTTARSRAAAGEVAELRPASCSFDFRMTTSSPFPPRARKRSSWRSSTIRHGRPTTRPGSCSSKPTQAIGQARPDAQAQAKNISDILKAYPHAVAKIGGYTDSTGSDAANLRLSRSRAESAHASVEHNGLAATRVTAERIRLEGSGGIELHRRRQGAESSRGAVGDFEVAALVSLVTGHWSLVTGQLPETGDRRSETLQYPFIQLAMGDGRDRRTPPCRVRVLASPS